MEKQIKLKNHKERACLKNNFFFNFTDKIKRNVRNILNIEGINKSFPKAKHKTKI